eukprot:4782862-Alexandrium_andersonii.AAC.1
MSLTRICANRRPTGAAEHDNACLLRSRPPARHTAYASASVPNYTRLPYGHGTGALRSTPTCAAAPNCMLISSTG